jgi:hypothetical protein
MKKVARFNLGDEVWVVHMVTKMIKETCPDCFGDKLLTVVLGNGEVVAIDCSRCGQGYNPPTGVVEIRTFGPDVKQGVIAGVEISEQKEKYQLSASDSISDFSYYSYDVDNIFLDRERAEERAKERAEELSQQQREKILRKERDGRTWAWNVSYHRHEIRRAEKSIEYHKEKLGIASKKVRKAFIHPLQDFRVKEGASDE